MEPISHEPLNYSEPLPTGGTTTSSMVLVPILAFMASILARTSASYAAASASAFWMSSNLTLAQGEFRTDLSSC